MKKKKKQTRTQQARVRKSHAADASSRATVSYNAGDKQGHKAHASGICDVPAGVDVGEAWNVLHDLGHGIAALLQQFRRILSDFCLNA